MVKKPKKTTKKAPKKVVKPKKVEKSQEPTKAEIWETLSKRQQKRRRKELQ